MLALWNYHLAAISAQICNKDNTSALCVYWCTAHQANDPTFGTTVRISCTDRSGSMGRQVNGREGPSATKSSGHIYRLKSATCLYRVLVLRHLILGTLYSFACPEFNPSFSNKNKTDKNSNHPFKKVCCQHLHSDLVLLKPSALGAYL